MLEHLCKRIKHLYGEKINLHNIFYMFSCAFNLRSFQAIYLKFAENVDILVQTVYGRTKGIPGAH